jgi:hypothetical protein
MDGTRGSINLLLTFAIVGGLAAISPPAISYYYGDPGPISASLAGEIRLASR